MRTVKNFDELMRLRTEAARTGVGSRAWIEFATVMFDSFPALYQTAKSMNEEVAQIRDGRMDDKSVEAALRDLIAQIELHTDCMDGRIDRSALDPFIEIGEKFVGSWPDFSPTVQS